MLLPYKGRLRYVYLDADDSVLCDVESVLIVTYSVNLMDAKVDSIVYGTWRDIRFESVR